MFNLVVGSKKMNVCWSSVNEFLQKKCDNSHFDLLTDMIFFFTFYLPVDLYTFSVLLSLFLS